MATIAGLIVDVAASTAKLVRDEAREKALDARRAELLTVKEYATLTRQHPMTIYKRIWAAKQPGVCRLGRDIRIDLSAV